VSDKNYTVPKSKLGWFIYDWREWGFWLAWSMFTDPDNWKPIPFEPEEENE